MAEKSRERVIPETPKGLSIRAKIGLIIGLIAGVSGLGAIILLWTQVSPTLTSEVEKRGRVLASGLATSVMNPILTESKGILKKLVDEVKQEEAVHYVVVADDAGKVLYSTLGKTLPVPLKNAVQAAVRQSEPMTQRLSLGNTEVINVTAPVVEGTVGTVHVGMSTEAIYGWVRKTVALLAAVGAVVVLAAIGIGYRVANASIAKPLQEVITVAESVGHGDLSREVEVRTQDEVGQLGATFNNTIRRLRKLVQTEEERNAMQRQVMDLLTIVSAAAEGDLTKEAEVTADVLGSLADAFNLMVNGLTGLVQQVRSASFEIENATRSILKASDAMRRGGEEQSRQITTASQVVNAMSRSMQQVAENAEGASKASASATEAALKGERAVTETIKGMHRIRGTVQTTSKKIKSLGERSMEIGAIVEVINDIATQTNLLALNAAIEAARAGEHGKGFAVVADEVRKLAERSAKATKDIANLIKGIQVETNEVVTAMEEGTREVEEGTRLADSAGAALKEIETIVRKTASLVADISAAARQQVKATEDVVRTMEAISGVTRQTSQEIQNTVDTIRGLADLSERLVEAVGRFKLAEPEVAVPSSQEGREGVRVAAHVPEEDLDLGFMEKK